MAQKKQKLGPRATVVFGSVSVSKSTNTSGKGRKTVYIYMRKSTAEYFGLTIATNAVVETKNKKKMPVRGSKGAGSIKIPVGSGTGGRNAANAGKGKVVYKAIPVPAGATIELIRKFIGTFKKNKPDSFVTKDGRTWGVGTSKK
jgi:hypothetical protein